MPQLDAGRLLRWVARAAIALAGQIVLIALAWVLSNLRDIDPVPRPAALALLTPTVPDENNAFFALVGLRAQADRDAAVVGRALWRLREATPIPSWPRLDVKAFEAEQVAEREVLGESQPLPKQLLCDPSQPDCVATWIAQAETLGAQRLAQSVVGQRCEKLLDERFAFEELLPTVLHAAGPIAAHASTAVQCSNWLLSGAVLNWTRHRPVPSVALFVQADRLSRALLAGSRTLVAQMIALRTARHTTIAIATLALRDPAMTIALAPLLAPWPDSVQGVRGWMVTEATFGRTMVSPVLRDCYSSVDVVGDESLSWLEGAKGRLDSFMCRHHIGWHPERTLAALDEMWLHKIAALDVGLPAAIEKAAAERKAAEGEGVMGLLSWRNTLGNILVGVGRPAFDNYVARQADIELQREATVLALSAMAVAPADRAAWTARQPQSTLTQNRLNWDATGHTLTARSWQQEYAVGGAFNGARDAIQITLPNP